MNRTTNRTPVQVSIPSSKDRYFNHIEWKGINDNKNTMGIDQQTFAEAENVYVNTEDILTSRPPITMRDEWGLEGQIVKFWAFGEHIAVQTLEANNIYHLWFIYNNELQKFEGYKNVIVQEKNTVILLTRKIFVLNTEQFSAYDIVDNVWEQDARAYIYVPRDTDEDNLLIQGTRERTFVWTQVSPPPWNYFASLGREIQVVIDGETLTLTYELGAEKTWVSKFTEVLNNTTGARIFKARDADTFAFLEESTNKLWYSEGGLIWSTPDIPFPAQSTNLELKMISKNGDGVYFFNTNGNDMTVWVFNISGQGASTWTYPGNNEFNVTATSPGRFTCIDVDSQFIWAIYYYDSTNSSDVNSRILYCRYSEWTAGYRSQNNIPNFLGVTLTDFQATCQVGTFLGVTYLWCNLAYARRYSYSYPDTHIPENRHYELSWDMTRYNVSLNQNSATSGTAIHVSLKGDDTAIWQFPIVNNGRFYQTDRFGSTWFVMRNLYEYKGDIYVYDCGWSYDTDRPPTGDQTKPLNESGDTSIIGNLVAVKKLGPGDINAIMDIDGVITQDTLYIFPYNQELATTTVRTVANQFPNYLPIANGLRLTPEDGMRRIWSQARGETGTNLYATNAGDINLEISPPAPIEIIELKFVDPTYMYFEHWLEWDDVLLSLGRDTYVAQYKTDRNGVFSWYITKSGRKNFNFDITGLHLLSNSEMAIFMEHEIWIATVQPGSGDIRNLYTYNKSKLPIGIRQGSDVMTTFDGRYILFSCERGLVGLQYQQFLATTEQALTFISDNIAYDEFNTGPIKLYQYKFWVIVYRIDKGEFFLLDMRNQSWWNWTFKQPIKDIVTYNEVPLALSQNNLFVLGDDTNYTDDGDEIKWKITSQLLHFDAINNFKQVLSLILNSVDTEDRFVFSLQTINYRKESNTRRREVFEYDVDTIRTFIKHMQFSKVNEFQYQLRNADKSLTPVPLKLTDISIKYVITERVR